MVQENTQEISNGIFQRGIIYLSKEIVEDRQVYHLYHHQSVYVYCWIRLPPLNTEEGFSIITTHRTKFASNLVFIITP